MTAPRCLLLTVAGLALAAPAAQASTASVGMGPFEVGGDVVFSGPDLLTYTAAPGEDNAVTLTREAEALVVRDPGALIEPGAGCVALDASTVRCVPDQQPLQAAQLFLADGNDTLDTTAGTPLRSVTARGGDGDDVLRTGDGRDTLLGEAGADLLDAGDGPDTLDGGPGTDELHGAAGGDVLADADDATPDVLDGGPAELGSNAVTFLGRTTPVTADLAAGRTGDGDTLTQIGSVTGGPGDDVLTGTDLGNRLTGSGGDDRLVGAGGDDQLDGGTGTDTVGCAAGTDLLVQPDLLVPDDCEQLDLSGKGFTYDHLASRPLRVKPRAITFRLHCALGPLVVPLGQAVAPCTGKLVLREGGRRLGAAAFSGTRGQAIDARVGLSDDARRRLRRTRTVTVAITGQAPHVSWQIRLRV